MVNNIYLSSVSRPLDISRIVDLGANGGIETVRLARAFSNAKVISVEPVLSNILELVKRIQKENLAGRCFIEHTAIDLHESFFELMYEDSKGMEGRANASLDSFNWGKWRYGHSECCRTKTPEQLCAGAEIVKVDIERHEYVVLESILKTESLKVVFLELHGKCEEFDTALWVDELCKRYGFSAAWFQCNQRQNGAEDEYKEVRPQSDIKCGDWFYVVFSKNNA